MRLRKQTRLKALITALTTGLLLLFFGLVRANPQIEAEADAEPAVAPDYDSFFAPSNSTSAGQTSQPASAERPHARTRGS